MSGFNNALFGEASPPKKARIEVIPLIDVVFFLLAMFAAWTSSISLCETAVSIFRDRWGWKRSIACERDPENAVTITVMQDGRIGWNKEEISLNHTKLVTTDGHLAMLPNKELASSKMINYTILGRRRIVQKVTASYDAPTDTVKAACMAAVAMTENVLEDPAPTVYLTAYKDSSIEYTVYCWATPENYWQVFMSVGENLRTTFAQAGVEMTYDHLNVHIVEDRTQGGGKIPG